MAETIPVDTPIPVNTSTHSADCTVADCAVIGAGPAGLTCALSLAEVGASVIATGPAFNRNSERPDPRTTAIFSGGITLLQRLGVWEACADAAAPLEGIRIIDDTGRLLRAPETLFRASEIGAQAFGYNIPNAALVAALHDAVSAHDNIQYVDTTAVTSVVPGPENTTLTLDGGDKIDARLVAGADGRRSIARKAAGIAPHTWDYDQAAVVCNFEHSGDHNNISTEMHRPSGPFTVVPLPGGASSLVWVETRGEAARLQALDDAEFTGALEQQLAGLLGSIDSVSARFQFQLSGMAARSLGQNRIALIGEAAHVVPPIGAQGLNLGFRDAAALADCVGDALGAGRDPGGPETLAAYCKARRGDVLSRTLAIDLLNRTLLSGLLPAQALRGAGLHALNAIGPLRRFVMREGMQPGSSLPRMMQPV